MQRYPFSLRALLPLLFILSFQAPAQGTQLASEFNQRMAQATGLWSQDIAKAESLLLELASDEKFAPLQQERETLWYNIACAQSLQDKKEFALESLAKAIALGFTDYKLLSEDSDLDNIRNASRFQSIFADLSRLMKANQIEFDSALTTAYHEPLSREEKIAGLSLLWSETKYNFAFFDQTDVNWDQLYLENISKVIEAETVLDYYKILGQMVHLLKDGHTNVYVPKELRTKVYARPEFRTSLVEKSVLVDSILNPELEDEHFMQGTAILTINGLDVHEYAQTQVPIFFLMSSTPQDMLVRRYAYGLLAGDMDQPLVLEMQSPAGHRFKRTFARTMNRGTQPDLLKFRVDAGIGIVTINSFNDPSLADKWNQLRDELQKTSALVIDIRNNGGGSTPQWLIQQLTDKPYQSNHWKTRKSIAAFRAWGRTLDYESRSGVWVDPDPEWNYSRPIAVLIGPKTFSAAEDFASTLDAMKRVTLVGEATGGSTGQPLSVSLPGGGTYRVCSKRDVRADGETFVGKGIKPHYLVHPTVEAIRTGKDLALEKALALVKKP